MSGTGPSPTITYTPTANWNGSDSFVVQVADFDGSDTITVNVTVTAVNDAPTITAISDQSTNEDTATSAIAFTVGDVETDAGSLTLSGSSSNPTLVPNGNIVFGGSGASRTVTLTPAANQNGSADITVIVSDGDLTAASPFTLTVTAVNDAPTGLSLSNSSVAENQPAGTPVGTFTTTDVDVGDTFTYTLASGVGATDNSAFTMVGNTLRTNALFDYETKNSYSIRVRATDAGGLWCEQAFTIAVTDVPEPEISLREKVSDTEIPYYGTYNLGTVNANAFMLLEFTITNTGATDLRLTGSPLVAVSGPQAAEFQVVLPPTSPIPSGGLMEFIMLFDCSSNDPQSATVTIANNDSDEAPYVFNLVANQAAQPNSYILWTK